MKHGLTSATSIFIKSETLNSSYSQRESTLLVNLLHHLTNEKLRKVVNIWVNAHITHDVSFFLIVHSSWNDI